MALVCHVLGVFTHPVATIASFHLLTSCTAAIFIDSLRAPAPVKLRTAGLYLLALTIFVLGYTFAPAPPMDYHKTVLDTVILSSFLIGRYFTLAVYVARCARVYMCLCVRACVRMCACSCVRVCASVCVCKQPHGYVAWCMGCTMMQSS